jgi:hypothetical protein
MAIIYSYPLKTTVKNSDQFVISIAPTSGVGAFQTNSITFETLKDSILSVIEFDFADDTAAAAGGVPVGGLYHNAGALRVRLT